MKTQVQAISTFKRILIPTDFSTVSRCALEYAKSIARQFNSQLFLLHVNPPSNFITPSETEWISQEEVSRKLDEQLEQGGAELRSEGFYAVHISHIGAVQDEILSASIERKVDLIVMGTHGPVGLERLLFGSDAEAVSRHVNCPLLVIGPAVPECGSPVWNPRHIICATSLKPDSAWIASYAYMLARQCKAEFLLCNVESSTQRGTDEKWRRFENALERNLPEKANLGSLQRTPLLGEKPGLKVVDVAKDCSADLIVMGAQNASTLATHLPRRTVPLVFSKAPCPVMTLHQ